MHAKELFQKKLHGKHSWNVYGLFRVENSKSNHEQKQSYNYYAKYTAFDVCTLFSLFFNLHSITHDL